MREAARTQVLRLRMTELAPITPRQRRWRINIFTATWLSYAGFYFCRKAFGVVKPELKEALVVNDFELAWIWTAYLIAYMCGQFLAGWLGARVACRRLLLVGMAVSVCCNLVFGASTLLGPAGYWPLMVFMILNGFAQATGWPGNIGTMAHWFRKTERGTVIGFWGTCYQLGSAWAKQFAGFMLAWMGAVSWSFWGASVVLFVIWIVFYFLHRDRPEDIGLPAIVAEELPPVELADDEEAVADEGWPPGVLRSLLTMGVTYFSFKFIRYALDSWSTVFMSETFDMSTAMSAQIASAFDYVGFLGVLTAGWVSDRFFGGKRSTIAFAMSVGMVFAVAFMWQFGSSSPLMFGISIALVGFTLFGPDSLLSGVGAIDVVSKKRAVLAAGLINGIGSAGPICQELIIGYLATYHSLDAVFMLLTVVTLLGVMGTGVLWWWGRTGKSRF